MAISDFNSSSLIKMNEASSRLRRMNFDMEMEKYSEKAERESQKFALEMQESMIEGMRKDHEFQKATNEIDRIDQQLADLHAKRKEAKAPEIKAVYDKKINQLTKRLDEIEI